MCARFYNVIMIFKLFLIISFLLTLNNPIHASKIKCNSVNNTFRTWEFNQRSTPKLTKILNNCFAEFICAKKSKTWLSGFCYDLRNPKIPAEIKDQNNFILSYKGTFKDGFFHGNGYVNEKNGIQYRGQFKKGKKEGYGKLVIKSENGLSIREGQWIRGNHYKGTRIYPSGNLTGGNYKQTGYYNIDTSNKFCIGKLEGQGKYESHFIKPLKYANGVILNGTILEGTFKCGKIIKGRSSSDYDHLSQIYDGEFNENEAFDGKGTLKIIRKKISKKDNYLHFDKKIKIMSGIFENNLLNNGIMTFEDGTSLEGYFVKGKFSLPKTKFMIGMEYKDGSNNKIQNYKLAKKNFLIAAENGYRDAMTEIAKFYKHQKISPELSIMQKLKSLINDNNYVQKISLLKAHMWANLANNTELRDSINLDDIHLIEAQNLAKDCKQKNYKNC